ncbi:MAG: hypothetical protein K0R34_345 [Herbinix sp.]|jgi:hypothetical protein|nr:hypothetical protein [Herbinix sp.]
MKISIADVIQEIDEEIIERMVWDEHNKIKFSKFRFKWRIMKELNKQSFLYKKLIQTVCFTLFICLLVPITAKAAIYLMLTQSAVVDDSNRSLIGTEITSKNYIIYKNGVYTNADGEVIDLDKLRKAQEGIPENRIIKEIQIDHYSPSSIIEVIVDKAGKNTFSTPEIILVNNSVCILTKEDGSGWSLEKGDTLDYNFEKYKSRVVARQNLIIGYVKDGVMYQGESYQGLLDSHVMKAQEQGEYFIYLLSASSDYLTLKQGELVQNSR